MYEDLAKRGYSVSGEHVDLGGVPVQFLAAYNALVEEAIEKSIETYYSGIRTRIFSLEHVIAIALQTGRPKDRGRVAMLLSQTKPDMMLLDDILHRYELKGIWTKWTS